MKTIIKDIAHEIKEMKTDRSTVRKFGFILTSLLLIIAAWLWKKDSVWWPEFAYAGGISLIITLAVPNVISPFYKGLTILSIIIGYFVSRVILTFLFVICFAPVGIFTRLIRRDLLNQKLDKSAKTYWIKRDAAFFKESCERLF